MSRRLNYSEAFRRDAVARMRDCDNIVELARKLRVPWRTLYKWKQQMEAAGTEAGTDPSAAREEMLRAENAQLKAALADKVLETDFFRGALQKVEARRRHSSVAGKPVSTSRSAR